MFKIRLKGFFPKKKKKMKGFYCLDGYNMIDVEIIIIEQFIFLGCLQLPKAIICNST